MAWKLEGHDNAETQLFLPWNLAQMAVAGDITERMESLLDDVMDDTTRTGTERESLHSLVDALTSVYAMDKDEPFRLMGDGFEYVVTEIDDAQALTHNRPPAHTSGATPSEDAQCGLELNGQTCVKAPGHEPPHRLKDPATL